MKLHAGQVVDVMVKSVKTYGLFCEYDGDTELLVLIPEISWTASFCSCDQIADVGDSITVKILAVDEASGKVAGSIRRRFPDPWQTNVLDVGRTHSATVVRYVETADRCDDGPAYLLELVPGAFAMLCGADSDLVIGDLCNVTITRSNPDARAVAISRVDSG